VADERSVIGRARTVLVFGQGDDAKAVVSTVVARVPRRAGRKRLIFSGRAIFASQVIQHLTEDVLPSIDAIVQRLVPKWKPQSLGVSVINLGAASAADLGLSISGYSADSAVFLACLSAVLRLPLRQDTVTTGHVACADGDIRPVSSLPAKLAAATGDPTIHRFVCPSLDADTSLKTLSPVQRERAADAMTAAQGELRIAQIADVEQLIRATADDDAIALASLRADFFDTDTIFDQNGSPVERAAALMGTGNDERFWRALETRLFAGDTREARDLLLARARHEIRQKRYPPDFGRKLVALVRSLPPTTRRDKGLFPLLPVEQCLKVARFATDEDHGDIQYLLDGASGRVAGPPREELSIPKPAPSTMKETVSAVLAEISTETLAKKIGQPIDSARATYVMDGVIIEDYEVFRDAIAAFYLALLRHTGSVRASGQEQTIRSESLALLEQAFADKGGANAAWAEARDGIHGGMRFVLDVMTEQFKTEMQVNHVRRVVKEAVDPLDWAGRAAFMEAFLERLGPHLPPEIRDEPPERFARHYETILVTYVQSLDRVKQLLRSL